MEHPENSGEYKGLVVNAGIEQPSSVNPYLKRKPKKRQLSVAEYVEGIVKGDVTILSRAVTLVESVKPEHQAIAQEVIEKCLPYSGNSVRVGISGVPGAGKSTSIDVFGLHVLEKYGGKLAVLAIDPSSERSKGSILGDKTRMEKLSVHPKSFIRPSPSAGSLGGVARKTRETIVLCEAAGFDKIFVETVGVGQSETADICRDSGCGTERDGCTFNGGFLPAYPTCRYGRRAARYQARHHGDGGRYRHQQGGWG